MDELEHTYRSWGVGYLDDIRQEAACITLSTVPRVPAAYYKRVVRVLARAGYSDSRIRSCRHATQWREQLHVEARPEGRGRPLWHQAPVDPALQAEHHQQLEACPRWLLQRYAEGMLAKKRSCQAHPARYWYLATVTQGRFVACHACDAQRARDQERE